MWSLFSLHPTVTTLQLISHNRPRRISTMSDISISLPNSPRLTSPPQRKPETNALLVTSLPLELFHSVTLKVLRRHFDAYGEINQWVPISCLRRIIIVYCTEEAAEAAKLESDPVLLEATDDR
jgi:hypothetical protein